MPLAERRAGRLTSLRRDIALLAGWILIACGTAYAAVPLQPLIDATPSGGTLLLAAGTYTGPAIVDRPMVLDGGGKAHIDGQQRESVLRVRANSATIRGLVLTRSGDSHDRGDCGIVVESYYNCNPVH